VAVNSATNQIYVPNASSNNVTVITEQQAQPIPLLANILPLSTGLISGSFTPSFNFTAVSNFTPYAPVPDNLLYQVDTWQGPWTAATSGGNGAFSKQTPALQPGFHLLYAYSTDGQDADSTMTGFQQGRLISNIVAYPFVVSPTSVTLTPSTLPFGTQTVGVPTVSQSATLTSTGAPLAIASIAISGDMAVTVTKTGSANLVFTGITSTSNFVVDTVNSTCSTSTPVPPTTGNTCIIAVEFAPGLAGALSGSLVLADNTPTSPQSVRLSGTGIAPALGLTQTTITFGSQVVGASSGAMTVTVSNTATSSLSLTSAPTASGDFAVDPNTTTCFLVTTSLTTNTCAVGVIFTPTATGTRTGSLSIPTNAGTGTVGLTGTGTAPGVSFNYSNLTFGSTVAGQTTATQTVTLTNTGTSPLTISALSVTGDFSIDPSTTCSISTPVPNTGTSYCTISVTFTPTVAGTRNGTVTVTDNANSVAGSMQTIALSGTGTAPGLCTAPSWRAS
jgi:hypothetical protein